MLRFYYFVKWFKFENLNVWHKSLDLSDEINELAKKFPPYELYNLCHQIKKAADSVKHCRGLHRSNKSRIARFHSYSKDLQSK